MAPKSRSRWRTGRSARMATMAIRQSVSRWTVAPAVSARINRGAHDQRRRDRSRPPVPPRSARHRRTRSPSAAGSGAAPLDVIGQSSASGSSESPSAWAAVCRRAPHVANRTSSPGSTRAAARCKASKLRRWRCGASSAACSTRAWSISTIANAGHSSATTCVARDPAASPTARRSQRKPARHMNQPSARCIASTTVSLPGSAT